MRAIRLLTVIACLALGTGCQSTPRHVEGEAGPAGSPATSPSSSQALTSPPGGPTTPSSPTVSVSPTAAKSPTRTKLTLGPNGIGPLRLGMTIAQAEATGVVKKFRSNPAGGCASAYLIAGDGDVVLHSPLKGVATIDAPGSMKTPQGIGVGSSLSAVERAYPDFKFDPDISRGYAAVPGNSKAVYRIAFRDGRVSQLTLQYRDQGCYE